MVNLWRGKESGDFGERVIDGELGNLFEFEAQDSVSPNSFPNMLINFDIFYDDERYFFRATKTADLDSNDQEKTNNLEQEWKALHDANPNVKYKLEYPPIKEEELEERVSGDAGETSPVPLQQKEKGGTRSALVVYISDPPPKLPKQPGWDIFGQYQLKWTNRQDPVKATDYCFELHHRTFNPHQLFATFEFDNLKGVMRLCPGRNLPPDQTSYCP
ncbi:hypothetical protein G7Y89_g2935 [Cudoniella acicularis]|uniref:Uncharacterized protein n=1 Tax=Cudoniella acicularis TaxID=354080 RepID=A0A8H4RTK2_9HELO|nr:hypothetical protein G7Y89_g2935 [Cudoniella acicularis]